MSIIDFLDKHPWVSNIITITGSVSLAAWQIGRQFKNTIKSQRASKLDELHLKIYDQIADKVKEFGDALVNLKTTVQSLPYNIERKILHDNDAKILGLPSFVNIIEKSDDIIAKSYEVDCRYLSLLSIIDKYELAFSNFGTMRIQINNTYEQMSNSFLKFSSPIYIYLPVDVEKEDQERLGIKVYPSPTPDEKTLENMKLSSSAVCDLIFDLMTYIHDLRIEAQNTLISPIFDGKKAQRRNPPDPNSRHRVLTVDE